MVFLRLVGAMTAHSPPGGCGLQASREYYYVGGQYINMTLVCAPFQLVNACELAGSYIAQPSSNVSGQYMTGQIYVEKLRPANVTKKYPLIFIHGAGQTGTVSV